MTDNTKKPHIDDAFRNIIGIAPPEDLGEPFATAFTRLYNGKEDEIKAAAYTCSLFLSAILMGFPTTQLHIFVHHVQENYSRFSFNCNMYDTIYKEMDDGMLQRVVLLDANSIPAVYECSKEDIFEAFDFYTNR